MGNHTRRRMLVFGAIIVIGSAIGVKFWQQSLHKPLLPIIGVVHETEIRIAPEISGRLAAFKIKVGQEVHKGDILAVLSSPELAATVEETKASLNAAKANLANVTAGVRAEEVETAAQNVVIAESNVALAKVQYARAAALAARAIASKQNLDESTATLSQAEAKLGLAQAAEALAKDGPTKEERQIAESQVELTQAAIADAEAQLAKTILTAPADGIVRVLVAEPGEAISAGQPVLTLGIGSDRWFTFTLHEDRLADQTIGSAVALETPTGEKIEARVTELRPLGEFAVWRAARAVGDHDINSFLLRADPTGSIPILEPGMTVWINPDPIDNTR